MGAEFRIRTTAEHGLRIADAAAATAKRIKDQTQAPGERMVTRLGAVESVTFKGVGPGRHK
jgi:hypothetical protein